MTPIWWYLTGGGLLAVVQFVLPPGIVPDLLYASVVLSSVIAVVVGVRIHRPVRRTPWYLMAAGLAFWSIGDFIWAWFDNVLGVDPFPSFADVAYLLGYPLLAIGVNQLASGTRRRKGRREPAALIDTCIVVLSTGLVLWVAFIHPTWTEPEGSLLERLVAVAYPVGDLVLLTQLFIVGVPLIMRSVALRLLAGAIVAVLVADAAFEAAPYLAVTDSTLRGIDPVFLLSALLWGAAALHPSMRTAGESRVPPDWTLTVGRLVFVACAALLLPLVTLVETAVGARVHTPEISLVAVGLITLVFLRMGGMLRRTKEQAARLAHLADTDFLTGLDSRRCFAERLELALNPADGPAAPEGPAVLLVGLERFAEISETLGHRTGDELLRAVAARLRAHLAPSIAVGRIAGDVFSVLLPAGLDPGTVMARARSVRELLLQPLVLCDVSVTIDGGVGVVLVAAQDPAAMHADSAEVLHRAEVALSAAREADGRLATYSVEMEKGGALAPVLMAELRRALASGEVVVHFQPQIEVATGRVLGAEALVRWQHPEHGLLAPITFVPAAERTGLIRLLTLHVLDRALAQCARWKAEGRNLTVAVNLSVRNLLDPGLLCDVREALDRHDLDPSLLELEITETMAMVDPTRSVEVLGALDALGVTLSIDDYGTGYGSLAYLQRLPVRRLKIDRSFVARLLDDAASAAIVRSTIELANHLGLSVVAEGVEDDATLLTLMDMNCYAAQGFGIGRPVAPEAVTDLIDAIHARVPGLVGAPSIAGGRRLVEA